MIDLIPKRVHAEKLKELQEGILGQEKQELSDEKISSFLNSATDSANGTVIGVSKYTGRALVIFDEYLNQVALILGTTGSGKTITLRRFYKRAIQKGYPLIVDAKPDSANIDWIMALAEQITVNFMDSTVESITITTL
ncbi:MAG: hypothetical protein H0W64_04875 [Gammaproteobacteria bacterium]|nr:hypothetical protein [Gammaproteobacteria bacterium]